MKKYRFFLHIVFLFLISCSSKDWSSNGLDIVELAIKGDALHFSKGFSIALIEGAVPEKTVSGSETTVRWKQGNIELALQFSDKSPEVKLLSDFHVSSKELASVSGRITSDNTLRANFGGSDLNLSRTLLKSPSGTGALSIENVMQLHLPFLYSVQQRERATHWRYVDDVELPCKVSSSQSTGYLRMGLPRVNLLHREPKLEAQIVMLISSNEDSDSGSLTQKINTMMKGHSQPTDPRFGNGGLAVAEGSSTFLGEELGTISNVSFLAQHAIKDCKSSKLSYIQGDPDMLYFPGAGYVVRGDKQTSRIFRSASLQKMKASRLTTVVHLVVDDKLLIKEGDDWTLSERSALDFADLELFAEDGRIEILGALEYAKRLERLQTISWSWSPDGTLTVACTDCDSIPGLLLRVEQSEPAIIPVKPKSYGVDGDVHRWDFDGARFTFKFENYRPLGIRWQFPTEK